MFKRYADAPILHAANFFGFSVCHLLRPLLLTVALFGSFSSGLARTFGRAALARPSVTRRSLEPVRSNALQALTARFASSNAANVGKIHQVIGAVVDGAFCFVSFGFLDFFGLFFAFVFP